MFLARKKLLTTEFIKGEIIMSDTSYGTFIVLRVEKFNNNKKEKNLKTLEQ